MTEVKGFRVTGKDFVNKFNEIKEYLGLESDAEVIRFLVNYFWKKFVKERKPIDEILMDRDRKS